MNRLIKLFIGFTLLSLSFLTGCTSEENVEVKPILEEEEVFSFDMNELPLITFSEEGMKILNRESIPKLPDGYPFPFEPDQLYEEYELTHTEDLLRIEADDTVYELSIIGPRLFLDEESDIELNTKVYLLDESIEFN
ncbi:hypothetical protein AB4027_03280 [Alkalibacterium putridalgicola]|uniref:hypothetical protein n=1 Tax=Alkalibacterium putridalgicola TaxID=426703 RepID=UPI0034CE9EAD